MRDHSAAAPPVAMIVARAAIGSPATHAAACEQAGHAAAFEDLDLRLLGRGGGERSEDPAAGRAAAGVDDPAAAVAALEAEREVAVAVGVELAAELLQLAHAVGGLVGQHLGGGALVRPRPASSVSSRWIAGESSIASAAAAPPCAQ